MRYLLLILPVLCAVAEGEPRKEKYEWHSGQIVAIVQQHQKVSPGPAESGAGTARAGSAMPVFRESLEVEGETQIYTVERSVYFRLMLKVTEGDAVQYAVDGSNFILKTGGKEYKFKLVRSTDKKSPR